MNVVRYGRSSDDLRIGDLIMQVKDATSRHKFALLGFPTDEGVRLNSGRVGAKAGPRAIREALFRLTPDGADPGAFIEVASSVADLGDIRTSKNLRRDQEALGEVLGDILARGIIPIILGGGHEAAFGHFLGYVQAGINVEIVNIDAHPDVRPLIKGKGHSGSPFREAIEHSSRRCRGYSVLGLNEFTCAPAHIGYLRDKGCQFCFRDALDDLVIEAVLKSRSTAVMCSLDLDALDCAYAPGVSAPNSMGLTKDIWYRACVAAGESGAVSSLDIVECNPKFDRDGQTARLAALSIWYFLFGVVQRLGRRAKDKKRRGR